jgi:hypothetical protein
LEFFTYPGITGVEVICIPVTGMTLAQIYGRLELRTGISQVQEDFLPRLE